MSMKEINSNPIAFTSRLMAYYRFQEFISKNSLLNDPFAELLAGNILDYVEEHKFTANNRDYAIIRASYIESFIIKNWLEKKEISQIVLIGAGLDTRAYRIQSLAKKNVNIFEIDVQEVLDYKNQKLKDFQPLCSIERIACEITKDNFIQKLSLTKFNYDKPTLWIFEGFAYYIERQIFSNLLQQLSQISGIGSEIFVDVCVPALSDLNFGAFTSYFKWGIETNEINSFFVGNGWNVSFSFADDHAQGRDVGQRGLIFVNGFNNVAPDQKNLQFEIVNDLQSEIIDKQEVIEHISSSLLIKQEDTNEISLNFISFIKHISKFVKTLVQKFEPVEIGQIVPRILRNPLEKLGLSQLSNEEILSVVLSYYESILLLIIFSEGYTHAWEFKESEVFHQYLEKRRINKIESCKYLCNIALNYEKRNY